MPQPDLEYILGYGSSGWLSGHLRAGEIGNASCGVAVRHRYSAKVFDGAGIWPQDLWLYQKDDGPFRLISRKPLDGLDILIPKIEIKMFKLLTRHLLGYFATRDLLGGGGGVKRPHVITRERMAAERRTMRRSKALDETILKHPLNFPN